MTSVTNRRRDKKDFILLLFQAALTVPPEEYLCRKIRQYPTAVKTEGSVIITFSWDLTTSSNYLCL